MTITYVVSGTSPNLTVQATDPYGAIITTPFNIYDSVTNLYNTIRNAIIEYYMTRLTWSCMCEIVGNTCNCTATDSHNNIVNPNYNLDESFITAKTTVIGAFVDLYGMSNKGDLIMALMNYNG